MPKIYYGLLKLVGCLKNEIIIFWLRPTVYPHTAIFIGNDKKVKLVVRLGWYTISAYKRYISLAESSILVYYISLREILQLSRKQYILLA